MAEGVYRGKTRRQPDDFGPCFMKFCRYFPYTAKLCIILGFALQPHGFTRAQLAACVDTLSGTTASPGRMTYDSRSET